MYSIPAIVKYVNSINAIFAQIRADGVENYHVTVSAGNMKIGRVMNVSTAPLFTCHHSKECKNLCYDIKANIQYKNVRFARAKNTMIAKNDRARYFAEIEDKISRRRKNKFFRWHVAGDIIDYNYFVNMVEIARRHPDFTFWTYTKEYQIVNLYCFMHGATKDCIPSNLSIMFSEWRGMEMLNPFGFGEFRVVFEGEKAPAGCHMCPGNCDICKENKRGCFINETTYCNVH